MKRMTRRTYCALLAGISLLPWGAATGSAHHSVAAEFDENSPIEFTGTVKQVEWVNPHGYMQVEVANDDGTTSIYRVQIGAPVSLYRQGWRKESVPPGTLVSFEGIRARSPDSRNVNGTVRGPNGDELWRGEAPGGTP